MVNNYLNQAANFSIGGEVIFISEEEEMFEGRVLEVGEKGVLVEFNHGEEDWVEMERCF